MIESFALALACGGPLRERQGDPFRNRANRWGLMMIRKASLRSGRVGWLRLSLLAGTILLPACSNSLEDHPPLYPVKGKVILNGKPMTGGTIIFEYAGDGADAPKGPGGGPFRATAKINDGTLTSRLRGLRGHARGKLQGRHLDDAGTKRKWSFRPGNRAPKKGKSAVSVSRYADPKTSRLTV